MIIDHQPLSYYVRKLREGRTFSLTKHSDASLYCMRGDKGGDCNGCDYTPELRAALLASLDHNELGFHHGIQRLTDRDREAFDQLLAKRDRSPLVWLDTGIFASQFLDGGLYPLIAALREMPRVVIVSKKANRAISQRGVLKYHDFIEVPESNAYRYRNAVIHEVMHFGSACYLFSCGMAATSLVSELHGKIPNSWFIDLGHLWDALLGNKIRHYQRDLTPDHIERNLRP